MRAERQRGQVGDPPWASIQPDASRQVGIGEPELHAFLDQRLRAPPWSAPCRTELKPVLLDVHFPAQGHVPALGNTKGLQDAHRRDLRRSGFAGNLAHYQLQGHAMLALHHEPENQDCGGSSGSKYQQLIETGATVTLGASTRRTTARASPAITSAMREMLRRNVSGSCLLPAILIASDRSAMITPTCLPEHSTAARLQPQETAILPSIRRFSILSK